MRQELEEKLLNMMLTDVEQQHNATLSSILSQMFKGEATQETIFLQLFVSWKIGRDKPIRLGEFISAVRGKIDDPVYRGLCDAFTAFSEAHMAARAVRRSSSGDIPIMMDTMLIAVTTLEVEREIGRIFNEDELREIRDEAAQNGLAFPGEYVRYYIRNKLHGRN